MVHAMNSIYTRNVSRDSRPACAVMTRDKRRQPIARLCTILRSKDLPDQPRPGPMSGEEARPLPDPVPRRMEEALELINSASLRIEDCAVEWQARVSRRQWQELEAKAVPKESWERSVLARTYFLDETLDRAMRALLASEKAFAERLAEFLGLLRGEEPAKRPERQTRDAKCQCPSEDLGPPACVRRSFADLVEAKIGFDNKFLGFGALLRADNTAGSNANATATACPCQICSNVPDEHQGTIQREVTIAKSPRRRVVRRRGRRRVAPFKARSPRMVRSSPEAGNDRAASVIVIGQPGSPRAARDVD
ncbi:uncharacterized protein LOC105695040 isoform X2 [Orussus abietinus]|uniref:uncharacterized protein LOC105695040 isoform X2 n=1 Tax=Orussus abietinus TaxID=222816 RepID=UPI000625398E|nr:uncharacterized protein LOC105695040 isoform X2 [Orussus abietinus]